MSLKPLIFFILCILAFSSVSFAIYPSSGGTISTNGAYTVHTFTSDGTFTPWGSGNVTVLIVAAGGKGADNGGGGGGGGGVIYNTTFPVTNGVNISAIVGLTSSANSLFGVLNATGGGYGGVYQTAGSNGGSGGGGGHDGSVNRAGGTATSGQGYNGGTQTHHDAGSHYPMGGGGGCAAVGQGTVSLTQSGAGGAGCQYNISGVNTYYSPGGGGGGYNAQGTAAGLGGTGGGGNGSNSGNGGQGSVYGAGGGGSYPGGGGSGGAGKAGIVIITYIADSPPPANITFTSPITNYVTYNPLVTFTYYPAFNNFTGTLNMSLYIDGSLWYVDSTNTSLTTFSHSITFANGAHTYYVNMTNANGSGSVFTSSTGSFTIASIAQQFSDYLNVSIASCSASLQTNLTNCNEFYKLTRIYNYSAIVCPMQASDLSCLGATINNYTKNNYTVIYSPSSWVYAGGLANITGLEHTGAIFYTAGAAITPGIELINSTHFIYLPAQTKDRDCTIKYLSTDSTTNCSYANGFVINNRQVIVSDRQGYFYTAGGLAVTSYNTNYSNMVIPVSLLPLQFWYTSHPETGVFTKMGCLAQNNTYTIDLINTVSKAFVVTVTGTGAGSYSGSGQSYYRQLAIGNDTNISVTADGYLVCSYTSASFTFMNINLSFINSDMLGYLYKMLAIFLVVISSVSPYFLFAFILFNDMFQTFSVFNVGLLTGFTIMLSLINNYQSTERGLKHVAMLFFIFAGFLVVFAPYWGNAAGVNFAAITSFQSSFSTWQASNNMADMTWNALNVIIQFFLLILNLPALIVDLIFSLINVIMPAIAQGFNGLRQPIALAFTVFVYIKAYEIITNKFRGV